MKNVTTLKNVTLYTSKDEAVLSKATGTLKEERGTSSFNTSLSLSGGEGAGFKEGESYYVVGLNPDGYPCRSEVVKCTSANGDFSGEIPFPAKPDGYVKAEVAAASSEADILITYSNFSSTEFDRSTWGSNLQIGFGGLTNSPGPILMANSGQQSIGASQILSAVDEGPADIWLCWAQGINFGVWIHFNFQMFGIGPRPVWYVTTNGSDWALAGSDPSDPYTWNESAVGHKIIGTPTSGHSSLTVEVVITNKS